MIIFFSKCRGTDVLLIKIILIELSVALIQNALNSTVHVHNPAK